ncbi:MAG TPA: type II secretion system protein [Candidatus Competibacteraceae bacterium]|nr:type II secretion system protein [Candidatus Competibacteraceae bacterium]
MRRRERGFTLLEVLVAFVILSLSLGVLMQVFSSGLNGVALAEEYSRATLYGESLLATLGREAPLAEGELSGELNEPYRWRASISRYQEENWPPQELEVAVYRVVLQVYWPSAEGERAITLETLRPGGLELGKP